MDLDLSDDQELLRDTVRGLCQRHCDLSVVRAMEDDPVGFPRPLWDALAATGILGLTVPAEHGGSDMTMLDAAVVYAELGRALAPTPNFVSVVLGAGLVRAAGTTAQRSHWLPRLMSGEAVLTAAWLEPDRGFGERGVALRAGRDGEGFRLSGVKRHVAYAAAADAFVTLARTDAGVTMFVVPAGADGLSMTQEFAVASDTQYRINFDSVTVGPDAVLGPVDGGWALWDEVMYDALILLGAYAAGAARAAHELTTQYAKDRKQFDKPLGAFQSIAHYLADGISAVDGAETLVYEAAWARSENRDVRRLAPMAKLFAGRTFRDVTATGQQIFGGVGFTLEYDIQLYFRRAKQLQLAWWSDRYLEELIAADVLDRPSPQPAGSSR